MVEICWNPRNNGNHLSTGALISISAWNLSSRFHSFHGHDMSSPDMRLQPRKLLLRWRATSTALSDPATLLKEKQLNTAQISKSVRSGKPSKIIIQIFGSYFDRKTQDPGVFKRITVLRPKGAGFACYARCAFSWNWKTSWIYLRNT